MNNMLKKCMKFEEKFKTWKVNQIRMIYFRIINIYKKFC